MTTNPQTLPTAIAWWHAGACPLPAAVDGTKRPHGDWKQWQHQRPTLDQLQSLFAADHDGLGVVCGATSDQLEMLELEGRAVTENIPTALQQAMSQAGLGDVWGRIQAGYLEVTPTGGVHYYYRVSDGPAAPNTRLASRPATPTELAAHQDRELAKLTQITDPALRQRREARIAQLTPERVPQVLIETRGEGGWSIIAPSAGRTHPTGRPWITFSDPASIPTVTTTQRDKIFEVCRSFDTMPGTTPGAPNPSLSAPAPTAPRTETGEGVRPGDDYNARASWPDILIPEGWTIDRIAGGTTYWIRPGKTHGQSATTGHSPDGDRLYVFSSSATPFEQHKPYDKFGAYTLLHHNGDLQASTRALREAGYGDQTPPMERKLTLLPNPDETSYSTPERGNRNNITTFVTPVDGATALATVTELQPAPVMEDNEDSLAQAFVSEVVGVIRYVPQRDRWLTWSGARWEWDEIGHHRELIKQLARRIPTDSKPATAFRRKMLSAAGISGVASMARTDPRVVVHLDDLDNQAWELNTPGGVVDLRTGRLLPSDPEKLHTRSTAVAPDFTTQPVRWLRFLEETFGGDREMISYMQRLMGVAAVGEVVEQILPFPHGIGANGKSVFVETCTDVLGRGERGYAIAANPEMLMARKYQEHPTELAQLAGARLVVCSELEDGARFAEARIKQLTGRDSISARFMKRDFFTFTPSHTFLLVANHRPQAAVGGPAFWRRLRLIPFQHVVPEDQRDPLLPAKLRAEWAAVLGWIVQGAADYHQGGMRTPQTVLAATEQYARSEDTMGRFVDEQCHLTPGSTLVRIRTGKLRSAYEQMCRELGDEPVSARRFTQELRDRFGVTSERTTNARYSVGITLLNGDDDESRDPREPNEFLL